MAPNGIVAPMVDGPSLENRFGRAEYVESAKKSGVGRSE